MAPAAVRVPGSGADAAPPEEVPVLLDEPPEEELPEDVPDEPPEDPPEVVPPEDPELLPELPDTGSLPICPPLVLETVGAARAKDAELVCLIVPPRLSMSLALVSWTL